MSKELKSVRLQMVIAPSQVAEIDAWRKAQDDLPSRSEAIRRLVDLALTAPKTRSSNEKAGAHDGR